MGCHVLWIALLSGVLADISKTVDVQLPLNERQYVEVSELVHGLVKVSGIHLERPKVTLRLPMAGLGGPLSKTLLAETLGSDVTTIIDGRFLILRIPAHRISVEAQPDWERRLRSLVERAEREEKRRDEYGMHALNSYRANDPTRPTVCLIHGLNSTSSVFWHMIRPIEEAGYGLVVYDFPYNRDLDTSSEIFQHDWQAFRRRSGDQRPWAIVAHSMGTLLARSYIEDDAVYGKDVASLIMIAPVNGGSNLSKAQTLLQVLQSVKAVNRGPSQRGDAMAHLGDGLGAAAEDMTPESAFLKKLNSRKRRERVRYHTLAGDGGFLSAIARRQIETQLGSGGRPGLFGGLARIAVGNLSAQLDEMGEGTGDGAVALASTRLNGVDEPVVLHVNHLELIRAPLLFPDPGPVVCMPYVLRWLGEDLPAPQAAKK